MAAIEKAKLATGEFRAEYITRRLGEGGSPAEIHAEINSPDLYGGAVGGLWPASCVYAEKRKLNAKPRTTMPDTEDEEALADEIDASGVAVPEEYEGILTAQDVAEVRADAKKKLLAKQRADAKKALLIMAQQELEHEARLEAQRGAARGDNVDVYIDLAPYAKDLRLDGVVYEHGTRRRVPRRVAAVLFEQMQRSWNHEDSLHGKSDRPFRRSLLERGVTANNAQAAMVRA